MVFSLMVLSWGAQFATVLIFKMSKMIWWVATRSAMFIMRVSGNLSGVLVRAVLVDATCSLELQAPHIGKQLRIALAVKSLVDYEF